MLEVGGMEERTMRGRGFVMVLFSSGVELCLRARTRMLRDFG